MGRVALPKVRLSFPNLFKAVAYEEGNEKKFGAKFILDPKDPVHKKVISKIEAEITKVVKDKLNGVMPKKQGVSTVYALTDGDDCCNATTGEIYDGYAGMKIVGAKNKKRITMIDADGAPILEEDGKLYAGCYVHATIDVYAMSGKNKCVAASLRAIKFYRDGEAFGEAPVDAESEFSEFDEFDEEDDL